MNRPTYTATSVIKKVFRPGERSLPRNEIINRLNECLPVFGHEGDSEQTLAEILQLPTPPIRIGSSDAIIELTYQPHQIFNLAYRYLRNTHTPRTMDQIIRELRRQTNFSWNQATRMLVLEQDPRFVQFKQDNRWYLAEWKVANDPLYTFAVAKNMTQLSIRALNPLLENDLGFSSKERIFLPELDERFLITGDMITFLKQEENEDLAVVEHKIAAAITEEQIDNRPFEEETIMNTMQIAPIYQEVEQLLRQSLSRLEVRNNDMQAEVVGHFQQSNMQAIEILMREKHKNEQAAQGIKQVLAVLDQQ